MSKNIPSVEEMEKRIIRFKGDLKDFNQHGEEAGIPAALYNKFCPNTVYPLLIPENFHGRQEGAALTGPDGLVVDLTVCPPGTGPVLHNHETVENFMCLSGKFEIIWGPNGEERTSIEQFDFVSVPPGVFRAFKNVSSEPAWLLVLIQITTADQRDDVDMGKALAEDISHEYGEEMVEKLRGIGFNFESEQVAEHRV